MVAQQDKAPVTVILGAQWGDEGKGKIIDYLIFKEGVQVTARCQGGHNAGHTVVVNGRSYDFHLIPSGMINENCFNVIGNGVVVNLEAFFAELEHNSITSLKNWEKRLMISDRAHIVCGIQMEVDGYSEATLDTNKIGTTKKGIGPTYSTKCFRNGLRMGDLVRDFEGFSMKFRNLIDYFHKQYPSIKVNIDEELRKYKDHAQKLNKLGLVGDTVGILDDLRSEGKTVLVEGANGAMLDIDFGTYPFVTSSNTTVGGALTGLGLPPISIKRVIAVSKAYTTRVGSGPFPTELKDDIGAKLQQIGKEIGVTTGRKRRCGWLDLVLLKRANILNGFTDIALTKLDVLDTFDEIKVAIGYKLNGQKIAAIPACAAEWDKVQVEYQTFPGWKSSVSTVRKYSDLPQNCRAYIEFIEKFVEVPIRWIGVGQEREALIVR